MAGPEAKDWTPFTQTQMPHSLPKMQVKSRVQGKNLPKSPTACLAKAPWIPPLQGTRGNVSFGSAEVDPPCEKVSCLAEKLLQLCRSTQAILE